MCEGMGLGVPILKKSHYIEASNEHTIIVDLFIQFPSTLVRDCKVMVLESCKKSYCLA